MRFILFAFAATALASVASAQPTLTHLAPPPPGNVNCPVAGHGAPAANIVANAHVMQGMHVGPLNTTVSNNIQATDAAGTGEKPPSGGHQNSQAFGAETSNSAPGSSINSGGHTFGDHENEDTKPPPRDSGHQNSQVDTTGQPGVNTSAAGSVAGAGHIGPGPNQALLVSSAHAGSNTPSIAGNAPVGCPSAGQPTPQAVTVPH